MSAILDALDKLAANGWSRLWKTPAWKQFITSGDKKHLKQLPKASDYDRLPFELLRALGRPKDVDEQGRRLLEATLAAGLTDAAGQMLRDAAASEEALSGDLDACWNLLQEIGFPAALLASQLVQRVRLRLDDQGNPTRAGRLLLDLSDGDLLQMIIALRDHRGGLLDLAALCTAQDAARFASILARLPRDTRAAIRPSFWTMLLQKDPSRFTPVAEMALDDMTSADCQFELASEMERGNPAKFGDMVESLCHRILFERDPKSGLLQFDAAEQAALWLATNRVSKAVPELQKYLGAPIASNTPGASTWLERKQKVLDVATKQLGRGAIPLLEICLQTDQPEVQAHAFQLWIGFKDPHDTGSIATQFHTIVEMDDSPILARCVRLAGEWNPEAVETDLWPLLGHKSRPVRDAAAGALAKLGESRVPKAGEMWQVRRADARLGVVQWLKNLGTPAAIVELKKRLDVEEDDNVRDGVLLALEALAGEGVGGSIQELKERIQKTLPKLSGSPVPWLDPKKLPPVKLKDGTKLPANWVLYLLYRQSRVKEMRADLEAKPLYGQVDRATSGGLALVVLETYLGSKLSADDRWTMAFAALLGDDRLVPVLTRQIKEWADGMRGKLAEYAVQALALLGTDSALLAVDAMAIRYRSKNKNIGKAASEAFAEAAEARGITTEELGDLVVPWLGFEPGRPRTVETGKASIEVRINPEFKLTFRDTVANKKLAKLPDSAPTAIKAEFKELAASLKEAVKSQLLRMENLMVRQFRWPVGRWQELYLRHPLLTPFAQRLVWGCYDPSGGLNRTFRALEDGSLTMLADEELAGLGEDGTVGIMHPLELAPEIRQAWLSHLADYDVVPPFAQLERPVVTVTEAQRDLKFGEQVAATELNAMTFKGRAERLGWTRGSVCDAGGINFYLKRFPTAGVDVFVGIEDMYVGIDMYSDIKLGRVFFVKHGSVKIGSYVYDEPGEGTDARLVAFGEVPAIAFSEAMGDLGRIAGKSQTGDSAPEE